MASLVEGRVLLDEVELRRFYGFCTVDLVTGCWNWTGAPNAGGYGVFYFHLDDKPKQMAAHIVSYNHFVGAVPVGKELAHYNLPENIPDKCAFYEHVRPATRSENMADKVGKPCKYGHNMAIWGQNSKGACKVCWRIRSARQYSGGNFYGCLSCGYNPCRCNRGVV